MRRYSPIERHPLYRTWLGMRNRCANQNSHIWQYYGGRGIKVCERWAEFASFVADMGERPPGTSLDRIDNDGNYKPRKEAITWRGQTRSITDWAEDLGITRRALGMRLKLGWTLEQAMTTPNRNVTHTNVRPMGAR